MSPKNLITYVALLRGINVGGNNIVKMADLKLCFETLGYQKVKTFINSGNIIFQSADNASGEIVKKIEAGISKHFKINLRVVVKDLKQITTVCKAIPANLQNNTEQKTDVLFLWDEVDSPKVLLEIIINPKVDKLTYVKGAVIWNVNRKDCNQSKMIKFISTRVYKHMTARNINTTRKIFEIMKTL